jgi:hypothetical protein
MKIWNSIVSFVMAVLARLGIVLGAKKENRDPSGDPIPHPQEKPKEKLVQQSDAQRMLSKLPEPHKCKSQLEAIGRYGLIKDGKWTDEAKWCSLLLLPDSISKGLINAATGKPTTKIYCNKDMQRPLLAALLELEAKDLLRYLKTFDGCFQIRDVRALPGKLSLHSYAIAIDLNAASNKLGTDGSLEPKVVEVFKAHGFDWGGDFQGRKDPMHFSHGWENR